MYTYQDFVRDNTSVVDQLRYTEKQVGVKGKSRLLKVIQVSTREGVCRLSNNQIIKITELVQSVRDGCYCISNPSALSRWFLNHSI